MRACACAYAYRGQPGLQRERGDTSRVAVALNNLGNVVQAQGDNARAQALFEESLVLSRKLGDRSGAAISLMNLAEEAYGRRAYGEEAALAGESLALSRELGDNWGIAGACGTLGAVARAAGNLPEAAARSEESLRLHQALGDRRGALHALLRLARLAGDQGQPQRGTCLFGGADALGRATGSQFPLGERMEYEWLVQAMRAVLGDEDFAAAWAAGRALSLEAAISLALEGHAEEASQHGVAMHRCQHQ